MTPGIPSAIFSLIIFVIVSAFVVVNDGWAHYIIFTVSAVLLLAAYFGLKWLAERIFAKRGDK